MRGPERFQQLSCSREHSFNPIRVTSPVMLQQLVLQRIQEEQAEERQRNGRVRSDSENSGGLRGILVSTVNRLSERNCGDSSATSGSTKSLRRVSTSDSARMFSSLANETHHRPAISKRDSFRIKRSESTRTSIREQREIEELDKKETQRREAKSSLEESLDNIERGIDKSEECRLRNGKAKQKKPRQKRKTRRVHNSSSFHDSCVSFCPSDIEEEADSSTNKRNSRAPSKTSVRKPKPEYSQNRLLESWNSSFGGSFNNSSFDPSRGDFWAWK